MKLLLNYSKILTLFYCFLYSFSMVGEVKAQSKQSLKSSSKAIYGIVDMQRIILTVEEGKQARAQLEKEIKQKEEDLKLQKDELEKMNKDWQEKSTLLSDEAKQRKQQEFQEKILALRNAEISSQNEIKQKEAQATQKIAIKVAKIVEDLAKTKQLKVVFERNTSGLLYLENPVDLTETVITSYNKENKDVAKKTSDPLKK